MSKKEIDNISAEDEYMEYWENEGTMKAKENSTYINLCKAKEEKYNMIIELTVPWQRKLVAGLIDEIKSIENARSSIEMENTVKLIYNNNKELANRK